jgi:hypothetical protein
MVKNHHCGNFGRRIIHCGLADFATLISGSRTSSWWIYSYAFQGDRKGYKEAKAEEGGKRRK